MKVSIGCNLDRRRPGFGHGEAGGGFFCALAKRGVGGEAGLAAAWLVEKFSADGAGSAKMTPGGGNGFRCCVLIENIGGRPGETALPLS